MSRPILHGVTFRVTSRKGGLLTTDRGDVFRVSPPIRHIVEGHEGPQVDDTLVVTAPKSGAILHAAALILVRIEGGCGCEDIALRVAAG